HPHGAARRTRVSRSRQPNKKPALWPVFCCWRSGLPGLIAILTLTTNPGDHLEGFIDRETVIGVGRIHVALALAAHAAVGAGPDDHEHALVVSTLGMVVARTGQPLGRLPLGLGAVAL